VIEVKIKSDGGHTFIIPAELEEEFDDLLSKEDWVKFNAKFGIYMKYPDDLKLYTHEI
jgi:hypothetical protein